MDLTVPVEIDATTSGPNLRHKAFMGYQTMQYFLHQYRIGAHFSHPDSSPANPTLQI
jgi:hypothetical protein